VGPPPDRFSNVRRYCSSPEMPYQYRAVRSNHALIVCIELGARRPPKEKVPLKLSRRLLLGKSAQNLHAHFQFVFASYQRQIVANLEV